MQPSEIEYSLLGDLHPAETVPRDYPSLSERGTCNTAAPRSAARSTGLVPNPVVFGALDSGHACKACGEEEAAGTIPAAPRSLPQ